MSTRTKRPLSQRLVDHAMSACGLVALLTIPLLWASWALDVYRLLLVIGCGAVWVIILLAWLFPDDGVRGK